MTFTPSACTSLKCKYPCDVVSGTNIIFLWSTCYPWGSHNCALLHEQLRFTGNGGECFTKSSFLSLPRTILIGATAICYSCPPLFYGTAARPDLMPDYSSSWQAILVIDMAIFSANAIHSLIYIMTYPLQYVLLSLFVLDTPPRFITILYAYMRTFHCLYIACLDPEQI